jgi:phosphatidylglycerophosphate synthase
MFDPVLTTPLKSLYGRLPIPASFPPEGIVICGHALAILAAFGFAYSTRFTWGGIAIAVGVAGNHIADCLDGTHARSTNQCRNGGELLDHFLDPLSFAYWLVGLAVSCHRLDLGIAAVICLYATAVLTNIRAKMIGEFTLARFGPTEFKTLLVVYGIVLSVVVSRGSAVRAETIALLFLCALLAVGVIQLLVQLYSSVLKVNEHGAPPDTTDWVQRGRGDEAG